MRIPFYVGSELVPNFGEDYSEPNAPYVNAPPPYATQSYPAQYGPGQVQYANASAPSLPYPQLSPSPYMPVAQMQPSPIIPRSPRRSHSRTPQPQVHFHGRSGQQPPLLHQEVRTPRHSMTHPDFHYSRCTGSHRAVCVRLLLASFAYSESSS